MDGQEPEDGAARAGTPPTLESTSKGLHIIERIGEGGMGEIFAASDSEIGRTVAVKWLKEDRQQDALAKSRFIAEARITGQLEHPGIVPVYEMGVDADGRAFYTMRRIRGVTLAQILADLKEQKPAAIQQYSLAALLTLFQKACDAVAYAHSRKVIHRDLKPENIMVGEFGEVVVMDWGLVKVLSTGGSKEISDVATIDSIAPDASATHKTLDKAVIGSPGFMAPEQADGRANESDERTDVFALGAILYAILTLRAPIEGQSSQSMIDRTRSGVIRPPTDFNSEQLHRVNAGKSFPHCPSGRIPAALSAVAMKALAQIPEERYQSVKELQAEIAAYQNGYATTAEEAGFLTHLALFVRRRRTEVALAAGAFAIVVILTAVFVWRVTATLTELQSTAPSFAAEAQALTEQGKLENALGKIHYAEKLAPREAEYRYREGNTLEALLRLKEARDAYAAALRTAPGHKLARQNLMLCDELLRADEGKGNLSSENIERLRAAIVEQGRVAEALAVTGRIDAGEEQSLQRWRDYLARAGFPGKLTRVATGGLELDASHTSITNLSILKGMPLSRLNASSTSISDLNPLRGMPLRWLDVQSTLVEDLNPLRGLPLEDLIISRTKVADLTPLKGMGLLHLVAQELPIKDLTPLKGMRLRYLNLYNCRDITNIRPLEGMLMNTLDLYHARISDITPLRNMPLWNLNLSTTLVSDLSPLHGIALRNLELDVTPISDLSPLSGMPLTNLILRGTLVSNLRPLKNMPLTMLLLHGCNELKDVTPLTHCRDLEFLTIPQTAQNFEVLRELPRLRKLSYTISSDRNWDLLPSPEDFWKANDLRKRAGP